MQTYEAKHEHTVTTPLSRGLANTVSFYRTRRCAVCETPLRAKPVQVLVELGDWHAGWQPFSCPHCSETETRFVIVNGEHPLVYQTHPTR